MSSKVPPPDCLIPTSWLDKEGVSAAEIRGWVDAGLAVTVKHRGGDSYISFLEHQRPLKFREVRGLIAEAREKLKLRLSNESGS